MELDQEAWGRRPGEVLATVLVLTGPALPIRYRGEGGLALAGDGLTDTLILIDRRFLIWDTAIPTTVEAMGIMSTVIHTYIHKLLQKHEVAGVKETGGKKCLTDLDEQEVTDAALAGAWASAFAVPLPPGPTLG